jgi:hypothetical protein
VETSHENFLTLPAGCHRTHEILEMDRPDVHNTNFSDFSATIIVKQINTRWKSVTIEE